ncbi:TonB-dependent receptor domain-containing protein [Phenylobacterium sp.]|uniref:TonB-dependent receptor domain-containing protein n=1 Tax=Phenylobacterium sp. TaxID=1871053 RepID=UPI0027221F13|nr:TonB-dependent receptor [Phenylobacterium sp.]MDO8379255.1 TonB-dependent receptor [Phenylobacterium sp.]
MTNPMKNALRAALLASVAAASFAAPQFAFAQTNETAKSVDVEELVVTGSRIRRADLTSIQPIQVITTETIDKRGFTNVADALNELPSSGIPVNGIGDQGSFGTGRQYINIFNLGTNRTLTLVNGRRFVGGNAASIFTGANAGGQVDFNVIPTALIDRIETIQAGGAAVYGSDAIAGVINIITKTRFEGFEADGLYGVAQEGDAATYRARFTGGKSFLDDRLNILGSYEYAKVEGLAYTDRDVTARQIAFAANPQNTSATDNIPGTILILNRRIPEVTTGGLAFRNSGSSLANLLTIVDPSNPAARVTAQFGPGGNLVPYSTGAFYQTSIASGGQGMNLAELTSLQSPVERHVVTGFAKYEFTDNIRLSGELFYNKQKSNEPFNQPIYNAALFGGNSAALRFSTANPFLTTQARTAILSQPTPLPADTASPGDQIFFLDRASIDIGTNKTTAEGETLRGVLNLDGDLQLFEQNFYWNLSANRGRAEGFFSSPNINQSKFLLAIDAVRDGGGAIVCRDVAARAAGCAPLNMFGLGSPSAAALSYVQVQFRSDFEITQTVYEGNFGGDLIDLPAGPLSFNVGFEHRTEESSFTPNDPARLGVGRSSAITAIDGKFDTKEYYGEALLPVFGGDFTLPGMKSLEFEGSYRKIDNSQSGEDKAWSYGFRWKPVDDIMFRASKSRSFRSPAIVELFLPTAAIFTSATDPCDQRNIGTGPNPATRTANCQAAFQALGLPANYALTSNVQSATVQGQTRGNPSLQNEVAEQWSAGFVIQPHFVPGLAITFDWTNIDLNDAIFNFNLSSILQVCYDSPTAQPDACSRFQRGNAGSGAQAGQILTQNLPAGIPGPTTGYVNAGYINFQGFTFGIDYEIDLSNLSDIGQWFGGNPGRLGFGFDLFAVNKQQTSVTGLGFDLNDDKNEIGNSDLQWKLETAYDRDPFSVVWTVNYIGQSEFNHDFTLETRLPLKVESYMINDLAFSYDLTKLVGQPLGLDKIKARFIVKNVADVEPPYGTTGIGVYDVIGRYFEFGLNARF